MNKPLTVLEQKAWTIAAFLHRGQVRENTGKPYFTHVSEVNGLTKIIENTINNSIKGNKCDLNFIDTSLITDMSELFKDSEFNGDISKWDVSNVTNMSFMFYNSKFNKDISKWVVSNVTAMDYMFTWSKFNKNINKWNVSNVIVMKSIFNESPLQYNSPTWYIK